MATFSSLSSSSSSNSPRLSAAEFIPNDYTLTSSPANQEDDRLHSPIKENRFDPRSTDRLAGKLGDSRSGHRLLTDSGEGVRLTDSLGDSRVGHHLTDSRTSDRLGDSRIVEARMEKSRIGDSRIGDSRLGDGPMGDSRLGLTERLESPQRMSYPSEKMEADKQRISLAPTGDSEKASSFMADRVFSDQEELTTSSSSSSSHHRMQKIPISSTSSSSIRISEKKGVSQWEAVQKASRLEAQKEKAARSEAASNGLLTLFSGNRRRHDADMIRSALEVGGVKFAEVETDTEDCPKMRLSDSTVFKGSIPLLMYAASMARLIPVADEDFTCAMGLVDYIQEIAPSCYNAIEKSGSNIDRILPFTRRIEEILSKTQSPEGYSVVSGLSLADCSIAAFTKAFTDSTSPYFLPTYASLHPRSYRIQRIIQYYLSSAKDDSKPIRQTSEPSAPHSARQERSQHAVQLPTQGSFSVQTSPSTQAPHSARDPASRDPPLPILSRGVTDASKETPRREARRGSLLGFLSPRSHDLNAREFGAQWILFYNENDPASKPLPKLLRLCPGIFATSRAVKGEPDQPLPYLKQISKGTKVEGTTSIALHLLSLQGYPKLSTSTLHSSIAVLSHFRDVKDRQGVLMTKIKGVTSPNLSDGLDSLEAALVSRPEDVSPLDVFVHEVYSEVIVRNKSLADQQSKWPRITQKSPSPVLQLASSLEGSRCAAFLSSGAIVTQMGKESTKLTLLLAARYGRGFSTS